MVKSPVIISGVVFCSLLIFVPVVPYCDEIDGPFSVTNENPFIALYGLPRHRGAGVLEENVAESRIGFNVNSNYEQDLNGFGDSMMIDGETEVWDFTYLRGLGNGWEAGVSVPLLKHSGGYLDRAIVRWHDWFGMPQGGRDLAQNDQLNYTISVDRADQFSLTKRERGIGDVVVFAGKALSANMTLRSELKLPTGKSERLMGSGGTDVNLSLDYQRRLAEHWNWGGSLSLVYLADNEIGLMNQDVLVAISSYLVYKVKPRLALKIQWDLNTRAYKKVDLEPMNNFGAVLSFGGTFKLSDRDRLDLIFMENLPNGEAAPDFGFKMELSRRIQP